MTNSPFYPNRNENIQYGTTRRLLGFIKPYWRETLLSILLSVATMAANIGMLGTSAYLIATAALHPSIAVLQVAIVGVRFFGIARGVFRYLERLVSHSVNFRVLGEIRGWFYRAVEPLVPGAVEDLKSGDLLGRSIQDIESLEDFYVRGIAPPLSAAIVTLGVSLFTLQYSTALAAVLALGLLFTGLVLSLLVRVFSGSLARRVVEARSLISALMVETLSGTAEILMSGAEEKQLQKISLASRESQKANLAMAGLHSAALAAGILISNLTLVGMLWFGIPLVRSGQMDGVALAVLALMTLASFEPVNLLPAAAAKIETSMAAARRLFEVADRPKPVQEPLNSPYLKLFNTLQVTGLDFTYPGSTIPALKDISFELHPGKKMALVGPSGSGKTTLLRILQHNLQVPGKKVYWNEIDAINLSSLVVQNLQAVLGQNAYLFSASLQENLRLANPKVENDSISNILQKVGLNDWFLSLPDGLDTWLGDNGSQLSGGERQRLLLARSLLMNRPILLADEPFSNLDLAAEKAILQTIFANTAQAACILATHRLVDMDLFDEILVMDAGQIIQKGKHRELISRAGLYQTLWNQQNNLFL
ncbi:MAG: thiol reductant ABC exporter subunit CydC [Leptolinea sp.]